jgi:hypothetical protein
VSHELKGCWSWHNLRHYPGIFLKSLKKDHGSFLLGHLFSVADIGTHDIPSRQRLSDRDIQQCSGHYTSAFLTPWRNSRNGPGPPHYRSFTITLRHTTLGGTTLDEWSARRRDLYQTTHNIHKRQTSMPPADFEPEIPASQRPQTYGLDRAATAIAMLHYYRQELMRRLSVTLELGRRKKEPSCRVNTSFSNEVRIYTQIIPSR